MKLNLLFASLVTIGLASAQLQAKAAEERAPELQPEAGEVSAVHFDENLATVQRLDLADSAADEFDTSGLEELVDLQTSRTRKRKMPGRPPRGGSSSTYGNSTYYSNGGSSSTYGNSTYYSKGGSSSTYGNSTYYSKGGSSSTYGDSTYYSKGGSSSTYVNSTYYSNGGSSSTYGNTTYFSNGGSCSTYGSSQYCS